MVPYVEKFSAEAQPPVAGDLLRFNKRHVKVIQHRSAESVSSQIAVGPRQRLRESCRIQIGPQRIERHVRIADQIRAVAKFARTRIIERQGDIERPARLQSRDAIYLPVRGERVQPTRNMSRRGYAPRIRNSKAMANVEIGAAIVMAQVVAVFRRPTIKSASTRGIIQRFGKSIRSTKCHVGGRTLG